MLMSGFGEEFSDTNRAGVDMLLTDLDTALTFMDVAQTSQIQDTIERNHKNARKAYDSVLCFLQKLKPDAGQ